MFGYAGFGILPLLFCNVCDGAMSGPTPEQLAAKPSEHMQQVALFVWARDVQWIYPCLEFMYAVPNGGFRNPAEAGRFKAEGVKAGVPDICLPFPNKGYHGLYLEAKKKGGRVSPEQKRFIQYLESQNYWVEVAFGYCQMRQSILNYLTD